MMTGKSIDSHQHAIDRFWHNYMFILEKSSIPKDSRSWYRKHLEMYISANKEVRLAYGVHYIHLM